MFERSHPFGLASRRAFLSRSAMGVGSLALASMLNKAQAGADNLRTRTPHFPARAKRVICLFQHGGPSQMDLFDPKPELTRLSGQDYPGNDLEVHFIKDRGKLLGSPFQFQKSGQSGIEFSELLPHTAGIADDMTLIRSMVTESVDHEAALRLIHGGKIFAGRPAWGSWVLYGLGSLNQELPGYVVLEDPAGLPVDGPHNWSSGFLPATYQGVRFRSSGSPVTDLSTPENLSRGEQEKQLRLLRALNEAHLKEHPRNRELEARINNFELAARMQLSVPAAVDLTQETAQTQSMYGIDRPESAEYGKRCLMARRLVERGVRFVQIFLNSQPWDTHSKNNATLRKLAMKTDQPSAALVTDLKQRGLLDSTIVIWAGEFGRLPISQGKDGRDHNRHAFSIWIAGGGFKAGYVHGATDDFAYRAVEKKVPVFDLQATLLHALGLDHKHLKYPNSGRDDSLTDAGVTGAKVVPELLS